jgi:cytochrome c oxidase subunit 2
VTVQLDLESTDVVHGWNLPELTGKAQAIPGKTNSIYFRADEPGIYENRSSMLSGQGYDTMGIEVHVVPPAEYEAAIDLLRKEIQFAQDKVEAEFELERKKSEISEMQAEKTENQIQNNQIESAASE